MAGGVGEGRVFRYLARFGSIRLPPPHRPPVTAPPVRRPPAAPPTLGGLFVFWVPLAATWLMMSAEGPFLAAVIARLADPTYNLAAYGVAFALAILVESPVIMLMSASTALVVHRRSFEKLRAFTWAMNALGTVLLGIVVLPPVWHGLADVLLALPPEVSRITHGALLIFLPWPAAIGYRRFLQGVLIRSGRTRLVAYGTVIRLAAMATVALLLYGIGDVPGAWVGSAALSTGVVVEAIAARFMAASAIRALPDEPDPDDADEDDDPELTFRSIAVFYWPLALTSLIGLAVQPMLTFFMGRAPAPLESLAVFPVVHALSFVFRSFGLSFQEAAIAKLGRRAEHSGVVGRFALILGLATSGALGIVAFTPLAAVWFEGVSGLTPDLAGYALLPARLLVPLPGLSVLLSLQRAILVQGRRTGPITTATMIEVGVIAVLFVIGGWWLDWVGVTAAFFAFLGGRIAGNLYLAGPVRAVLASRR